MKDLTEVRGFFAHDLYATEQTGIVIDAADDCYSRVSLVLDGRHKNAAGFLMGGVICTLADFAFAVATNSAEHHTVTVTSQQSFLSSTRGTKLFAECKPIREGRHTCFYEVSVTDDLGADIARVSLTGLHLS